MQARILQPTISICSNSLNIAVRSFNLFSVFLQIFSWLKDKNVIVLLFKILFKDEYNELMYSQGFSITLIVEIIIADCNLLDVFETKTVPGRGDDVASQTK